MTMNKFEKIDGKYLVTFVLGEGSVGTVYLAEHLELKAQVAIKVLKASLATDPVAVERFRREAQAASRLVHPHIVRVHDIGTTPDGALYFVMDYIPGKLLREVLARQHKLSIPEARDLLLPLADALAYAHEQGVVHRDFKPDNIILRNYEHEGLNWPMILDFGLAKFLTDPQISLTITGELYGTPEYMAPEQAEGRAVDARSDVYAFGVVAYEVLTGRLPFLGNFIEQLAAKRNQVPDPPSAVVPDRAIPAGLERVILRCLARDPNERYANGRELLVALEEAMRLAPAELYGRAEESFWLAHEERWCEKMGHGQPRLATYEVIQNVLASNEASQTLQAFYQCLALELSYQTLRLLLCDLVRLRRRWRSRTPVDGDWDARLDVGTDGRRSSPRAELVSQVVSAVAGLEVQVDQLRQRVLDTENALKQQVGLLAHQILRLRDELDLPASDWERLETASAWRGWHWPDERALAPEETSPVPEPAADGPES